MWAIAGKSVIGTAHQKSGAPCQDFAAWHANGSSQRVALAISDGAGFAIYARSAAELSVRTALDLMLDWDESLADLDAFQIRVWLAQIKEVLKGDAELHTAKLTDYSCTLLGAIIDGDRGFFWQVGDGAWVIQSDAGISAATWPFSGDYINETVFVVSATGEEKFTHAHVDGLRAVMGFTDGLEHLCLDFPNKTAHEPFVSRIVGHLNPAADPSQVEQSIQALLSSELVNDRTDDDKTLLLAWRTDSPSSHADG